MMPSLLVATRNRGKVVELHTMLDGIVEQVLSINDVPPMPETIEDGETFVDNALKKAREACHMTGLPTLADDSGLVVPLLDGAPGIYSARYAGIGATDAENNAKLLSEIERLGIMQPPAQFVCCLAYVTPDGFERVFTGAVDGVISSFPKGDHGFGYDPLFLVAGFNCTMAELPLEIKNSISHRAQALQNFVAFLRESK